VPHLKSCRMVGSMPAQDGNLQQVQGRAYRTGQRCRPRGWLCPCRRFASVLRKRPERSTAATMDFRAWDLLRIAAVCFFIILLMPEGLRSGLITTASARLGTRAASLYFRKREIPGKGGMPALRNLPSGPDY